MPLPDHTMFMCCQNLSQSRSLYLSWASPEPVIFGDTLTRLGQLETLDVDLSDFSGLQQLPPRVTSLGLHAWNLLDMATAPGLQSCSRLQSMELISTEGGHTLDFCWAPIQPHLNAMDSAWLAGVVNFQLGHWPALTKLKLSSIGSGDFRLHCWPPLEARAFSVPRLAELEVSVRSDATGLLQLEHTILGLMLNSSAAWHETHNVFHHAEPLTTTRWFGAKRCSTS